MRNNFVITKLNVSDTEGDTADVSPDGELLVRDDQNRLLKDILNAMNIQLEYWLQLIGEDAKLETDEVVIDSSEPSL